MCISSQLLRLSVIDCVWCTAVAPQGFTGQEEKASEGSAEWREAHTESRAVRHDAKGGGAGSGAGCGPRKHHMLPAKI